MLLLKIKLEMDLRDYCNILLLLICSINFTFAQEVEVRCIDPKFDQLVDNYLDYSIPVISVADAYHSKDKFIFLDAREIEEYNTSHISNSIHIGYDDFDLNAIQPLISKDSHLIIYCSIGYRSEKIGKILKKNGYQSIFNLYGSIFEWVNQHHPIFDQKGNETNSLHTFNKNWSKWVRDDGINKVWE